MAKTNYLNNKDMLSEIHKSKTSYCSFPNPEDNQYDLIVLRLSEINEEAIEQAKIKRAARLSPTKGDKIDPATIAATDLVFRVMTYQHIPLAPPKVTGASKKSKQSNNLTQFFEELVVDVQDDEEDELITSEMDAIDEPTMETTKADHIRVNFPPFFHYKLDEHGMAYIVGKSHWIGDLYTGEFCQTHGHITDTLALMIMKLAQRFSTKGNWYGYSYRDEMEAQAILQLCQVALVFSEYKSQNPFAFYTQIATNSFRRVLALEKKSQKIRDKMLMESGQNPSYTFDNSEGGE